MQHVLEVNRTSKIIGLGSDIVYMQHSYWCECTTYPLKLSFMAPRHTNPSDKRGTYPLLVFLCGGAWMQMDRNVWIPSLVYFAEKGFAVASVQYSTMSFTEHPDQVKEIKTAIRFLRAHAEEFCIDPERVAIMGESAGAYLAGLTALTGDAPEYRNGYYKTESDSVKAVVALYSPTDVSLLDNSMLRIRTDNFPDLSPLVEKSAPPYLLIHGDQDRLVPCSQSELLYEKLQRQGIESELYIVKDAGHADVMFVQPEIKELIFNFLCKTL